MHPQNEILIEKMKHISKLAAVVLAALTVASCNNNKFTVEGQISGAKDSVLYFENVGIEGINVLDSAKLGDNGDFSFSEAATQAPEFYRKLGYAIEFVREDREPKLSKYFLAKHI